MTSRAPLRPKKAAECNFYVYACIVHMHKFLMVYLQLAACTSRLDQWKGAGRAGGVRGICHPSLVEINFFQDGTTAQHRQDRTAIERTFSKCIHTAKLSSSPVQSYSGLWDWAGCKSGQPLALADWFKDVSLCFWVSCAAYHALFQEPSSLVLQGDRWTANTVPGTSPSAGRFVADLLLKAIRLE